MGVGLFAIVSVSRHEKGVASISTTPSMPTPASRLLTSPLPPSASQADHGAQVFILVCQDCHGDRGQGLTDAWRATWAPQDQNCWKSKCHAANHPPGGFVLPHYVPPVVGQPVVDRYATAGDLHAFIQQKMPWYAPGMLSDDEYWQVTAFLMRANGSSLDGQTLSPATAFQVRLRPATQAAPTPAAQTVGMAWGLILAGAIIAGLFGLALLWQRRSTHTL